MLTKRHGPHQSRLQPAPYCCTFMQERDILQRRNASLMILLFRTYTEKTIVSCSFALVKEASKSICRE